MTPQRLVEIALKATHERLRVVDLSERLKISQLLELEEAENANFKLKWHKVMPDCFGDCWGCVETEFDRSVAHFVEETYVKGHHGDWFSSHVLAHEFGHYKLAHAGINKLAPTMKGSLRTTGAADDPAEELEADAFATIALVPLTCLLGQNLDLQSIASRYCEEPKWIKKFVSLLRVPSVNEPLKAIVKERGWG